MPQFSRCGRTSLNLKIPRRKRLHLIYPSQISIFIVSPLSIATLDLIKHFPFCIDCVKTYFSVINRFSHALSEYRGRKRKRVQTRKIVWQLQPPRAQGLVRVMPFLQSRLRGFAVSSGVSRDRWYLLVQQEVHLLRAAAQIHR